MELHAVQWEFAMAEAHDFLLRSLGGDLEIGGECLTAHKERVIARGLERIRQAGENAFAVVDDR